MNAFCSVLKLSLFSKGLFTKSFALAIHKEATFDQVMRCGCTLQTNERSSCPPPICDPSRAIHCLLQKQEGASRKALCKSGLVEARQD